MDTESVIPDNHCTHLFINLHALATRLVAADLWSATHCHFPVLHTA
jgi:hypothetical protein